MERLEEYANEESSFTEHSNSKREPIQEAITNNYAELEINKIFSSSLIPIKVTIST